MNIPPPLIFPLLAPSDNVGDAMHRIFNYVVLNDVVPSDDDLVHLPQVLHQLQYRSNRMNFDQRFRLNTLRNRNQGVG